MGNSLARAAIATVSLVFLMGHDHGGCDAPGHATGAACDPALTWDNFGADFMQRYCTSCHSSRVSGGQRHGAPVDHDFDMLSGVQLATDHIDESAAAGPQAINTYMPPYGPMPTTGEREQLGRWLACGAP